MNSTSSGNLPLSNHIAQQQQLQQQQQQQQQQQLQQQQQQLLQQQLAHVQLPPQNFAAVAAAQQNGALIIKMLVIFGVKISRYLPCVSLFSYIFYESTSKNFKVKILNLCTVAIEDM